jgi:hypothetical protein
MAGTAHHSHLIISPYAQVGPHAAATLHCMGVDVPTAQVSPFLACIGSPCLRHCVHGVSICMGVDVPTAEVPHYFMYPLSMISEPTTKWIDT